MLRTNTQQFQQPEYPALPVIFQPNLDNDPAPRTDPPLSTVPQAQTSALLRLTQAEYDSSYKQLFAMGECTQQEALDEFFSCYKPVDEGFYEQFKADRSKISFLRLGAKKIYVGEMKDKKFTGKAVIMFKNGSLYEGHMQENKRSGKGSYINGSIGWYKGEFKNDLKDGEGIEIIYKSSAYKGHFLDGLRHDIGLYIDMQSNIYEGTWKLGIMHGKGTLKTRSSTYTGMFVNWLKHGLGEEVFANGDVYRGEYQNGRFDGIGGYEWKAEGAFYEGSFRNGLRHGKGKWQRGETKYNGGYSEGLKEGYGELYFPSGNFYKGNFVQDKKQGYGEMFWTDSSFYKGQWKNGHQHGKGQIYLAGSDIVSGIFQNSILVQAIPSIYQKQMQISNLSGHGIFDSKNKIQREKSRNRTFSDNKGFRQRKKLARIEESMGKNKRNTGVIAGKIYFKSPEKSDHSDGTPCNTCIRRSENFRLKQQTKRIMHNTSIRPGDHHQQP